VSQALGGMAQIYRSRTMGQRVHLKETAKLKSNRYTEVRCNRGAKCHGPPSLYWYLLHAQLTVLS
jgi:hypothetical protein